MIGMVEYRTPIGQIKHGEILEPTTIQDAYADLGIPSNQPIVCALNGQPMLRKDWGAVVTPTDTLSFIQLPRGGFFKNILGILASIALAIVAPWAAGIIAGALGITSSIGVQLITAGIFLAGSMLISSLMKPPKPPEAPSASPTYSLGAQGNQARLYQPVPRLYGNHIIYPDFASQPFTVFQNNDQYLYQLFCVSLGEVDIESIRIEDTELWNDEDGYVSNFVGITIEIIPPGGTVTLFPSQVSNSVEVGGQELRRGLVNDADITFTAPHTITVNDKGMFDPFQEGDVVQISNMVLNSGTFTIVTIDPDAKIITVSETVVNESIEGDITRTAATSWVGPFVVCEPDDVVTKVQVDFIFQRGLYRATDEGGLADVAVTVEVELREIDSAGLPIGSWMSVGTHTYTKATITPQRITEEYEVATGRYEARVRRVSTQVHSTKRITDVVWGGLRGFIPDDNTYDNVTLIAMKMMATGQLTNTASRKINVIATGIIPVWNGTVWTNIATRSIAWAAADILRNTVYGASFPDSRIDLETFLAFDSDRTASSEYFDGIFDNKQTVLSCLESVFRAGRAQPLQIAGVVTLVRDEPRTIPKGVFTPHNIIRNSFKTTHVLYNDESADDVIIEFIDRRTWKRNEVQCSLDGSVGDNPARVNLFGVTDRTHAWREGMYLAAVNAKRRIFASFGTELEGRLLKRGDLITVAHDLFSWGASRQVMEYDSTTRKVTLSEKIELTAGSPYILFSRRDGSQFGPVLCSVNADGTAVTLDETDLAAVEAAQTIAVEDVIIPDDASTAVLTRAVIGVGTNYYRKWLVVGATFRGQESVELVAVNEDPDVYTADVGTPPVETWPFGPGAIPDSPVVSNLLVTQDPGSTNPVVLNATWQDDTGSDSFLLQISYDNQSWTTVYSGASTNAQFSAAPGLVYVRVAGFRNFRGDFTTFSGTFGASTVVPADILDLTVTAVATKGYIEARWSAAARATAYHVELWAETVAGSGTYDDLVFDELIPDVSKSWDSDEITDGGGWWPSVRVNVWGVNSAGESELPDTVTQTITLPAAPVVPTIDAISVTDKVVSLTITAGNDVGHKFLHLYRAASGGAFGTAVSVGIYYTTANQTLTITDIPSGYGNYDYFLTAGNAYGVESAPAGPSAAANAGFEPESFTAFSAFTTAPSLARKKSYNTLIKALKDATVWTALDGFYVLAAHAEDAALINLKTPGTHNLTKVGAPVFTADRGFKGDGVDDYLEPGFNPATAGGNFSLNSAYLGVWIETVHTNAGTAMSEIGNAQARLWTKFNATNIASRLNDGTSTTGAGGGATGYYDISRKVNTGYDRYHNTTTLTAAAVASTSVTSANIQILRASTTTHSDARVAAAVIGGGLTATQRGDLRTALRAYMTDVGVA